MRNTTTIKEAKAPSGTKKKKEGKPKILLVDDDVMTTEMLTMQLEKRGFEVQYVLSAIDALKQLSANKYDVIITDLMMPDISGLTLISLLKNYVFEKIPVIIITSLDQPTFVLSGIGLGADDYFVKPIDIERLAERINRLLSGEHNREPGKN